MYIVHVYDQSYTASLVCIEISLIKIYPITMAQRGCYTEATRLNCTNTQCRGLQHNRDSDNVARQLRRYTCHTERLHNKFVVVNKTRNSTNILYDLYQSLFLGSVQFAADQ